MLLTFFHILQIISSASEKDGHIITILLSITGIVGLSNIGCEEVKIFPKLWNSVPLLNFSVIFLKRKHVRCNGFGIIGQSLRH